MSIENPPATGKPARLANHLFILVLQHPQEKKRALGTASLLVESLAHAKRVVGLSWPGLKRILRRDDIDPRRWGVLYLGTAKERPPANLGPLVAIDRDGRPLADQATSRLDLEGLILLDGNWAQAKTLWWRNPWLLKLRRFILLPDVPSAYGTLRKEPRATAISTIEAAAIALGYFEQRPEIEQALKQRFADFLDEIRGAHDPQTERS